MSETPNLDAAVAAMDAATGDKGAAYADPNPGQVGPGGMTDEDDAAFGAWLEGGLAEQGPDGPDPDWTLDPSHTGGTDPLAASAAEEVAAYDEAEGGA